MFTLEQQMDPSFKITMKNNVKIFPDGKFIHIENIHLQSRYLILKLSHYLFFEMINSAKSRWRNVKKIIFILATLSIDTKVRHFIQK